jgi:hypothetical protein
MENHYTNPPPGKALLGRTKSLPAHLKELETKPVEKVVLRQTIKGETAEDRAKAIEEIRKRKVLQAEEDRRQQNALFLFTLTRQLRPSLYPIGNQIESSAHVVSTKMESINPRDLSEKVIDYPSIYSEASFEIQKQAIARFEADRKAMDSIKERAENQQLDLDTQALRSRSAAVMREMEKIRWNSLSDEEKSREFRIKEMLQAHDKTNTREKPSTSLETLTIAMQEEEPKQSNLAQPNDHMAMPIESTLSNPRLSHDLPIARKDKTTQCSCQIM